MNAAAPMHSGDEQPTTVAALLPALACPSCRRDLVLGGATLTCGSCGLSYPVVGNVPVLLDPVSTAEIAGFRNDAENVRLRQQLSRGGLAKIADLIRPPHPFAYTRRRVNRKKRIAFSQLAAGSANNAQARFLDIGSGILGGLNHSGLSAHVRSHLVPLEIAPTGGVGVVGDAHKLPFRSDSLDGALIQGVLEHVREPAEVVAEIFRTLKPGAPVFAEVPFIQHYHLDPVDYRRWTHYGFERLFGDFACVEAGVNAGPASALTDMLTEFPALLFRAPTLYWGTKVISGWLFSPLQLLDVVWGDAPRAHIMPGAVYFLGRKPETTA
jgi:uncharacterized protein YbaR (Trm112 family)/SAM-dependent methyltransferase